MVTRDRTKKEILQLMAEIVNVEVYKRKLEE